ncbi:FAD-binding oxidoreductase [Candidatus Ferrigenium straubiae]|jgi:FAD/FMN-containing dehydrogenase|uniref:FAD-binding oxidoreductase n=1 Tax=Candidatus Ferrigenium straubiae TaxID=2919506 RepID=UPI003F4A8BB5
MATNFLDAVAAIVGGDGILSGETAAPYYADKRGRYFGSALAVVFPSDTQQVSAIVELCAASRIAIVPQGGNTSLCGASVPLAEGRQIVLNLSRMKRIRAIDAVNYTMTVEAGCILADAREAAEQHDRLFPLELTATLNHCEIGGNLSTNAGGNGVLRYGNARDLVLGLEVVLPDGRIWNGLRSLRKDNSGYDLKHLFIGAEGTLGIITAAVLKLYPRPRSSATAVVAIPDPALAVRLLAHVRAACGDTLSAFELVSRSSLDIVFRHVPGVAEPFTKHYEYYLLIQSDDMQARPLDGALRDAITSFGADIPEFAATADAAQAANWWKLRQNISDAQKREGISIKHDISVPVSRVAEFIARADAALQGAWPGVRIVAFGHMGDGNIHYNVSLADAERNNTFIEQHEGAVNRLVYEVVRELGGSISAEHGLGQLKRATIRDYKDPLELELMRSIKQVFDPQGLMNPGKVL